MEVTKTRANPPAELVAMRPDTYSERLISTEAIRASITKALATRQE